MHATTASCGGALHIGGDTIRCDSGWSGVLVLAFILLRIHWLRSALHGQITLLHDQNVLIHHVVICTWVSALSVMVPELVSVGGRLDTDTGCGGCG